MPTMRPIYSITDGGTPSTGRELLSIHTKDGILSILLWSKESFTWQIEVKDYILERAFTLFNLNPLTNERDYIGTVYLTLPELTEWWKDPLIKKEKEGKNGN